MAYYDKTENTHTRASGSVPSKVLPRVAGLYVSGLRYYSANLSRWINRDPIEEFGGLNYYEYVENCPTTLIDVQGLTGRNPNIPACPSMVSQKKRSALVDFIKDIESRGRKLTPDQLEALHSGCIGLTCIYQGTGQSVPEEDPNTTCFLGKLNADAHKCKPEEESFIFAKQGRWINGKPTPSKKDRSIAKDAISMKDGHFNYITRFNNGQYGWMNHCSEDGPQDVRIAGGPLKDREYPDEMWCVTCRCKGGK